MWFRLMMLAFVINGLCGFGPEVLKHMGIGKEYSSFYLMFWYLAGASLVIGLYLKSPKRPTVLDVVFGAALGLFSFFGQTSVWMALNLSGGLPGNVVYPVAYAGGMFIVVALGVLVFRERLGPAGIAGIVLGLAAVAMLSLP